MTGRIALLLLLLAAACTAERPPSRLAFSPEEAAFIRKPGNGSIAGHAFRTRDKGQVVDAAGEVVRLVPVTAYSRERFEALYGGRKFLPASRYPRDDANTAYAEYTRSTKTESNGRFTFDKVPPGRYFVTTQVIWNEQDAFGSSGGGSVYDEVVLTGRETEPVKVILSGN